MIYKHRGFTIAEVMVVVSLIGILLTLVLVNLNRNRVQTRDNIRVSDIQTIRLALEEYRANCGVFPATLELDSNNTRTSLQQNSVNGCRFELGDFIPEIPDAPIHSNGSILLANNIVSNTNDFSGYFYAALSTRPNGPCFEYHIGAELEFATDNGRDPSKFLSEDHDFIPNDGRFDHSCVSSPSDFGNNIISDDNMGLYDFRSQKSLSN